MTTVAEAIMRLKTIDPNKHIAVAIWSTDDVIDHARNVHNKELTVEQANIIIDNIDRKHDAELGINWITLDVAIEDIEQS